jgi:hypothetical protein
MVTIKGNLDVIFWGIVDVFVAGDLLWYAVEGNNKIRQAPDVMVVFGRPKGHRGSYRQWEEEGIAPQVVFEILSPWNRHGQMVGKFHFYEQYGVEEYYVYDPDRLVLEGWIRRSAALEEIPNMQGWVSPRLGIRFELAPDDGLKLYRPDGCPFLSFVELHAQGEVERLAREQAEQRADQAERQAEHAQHQAEHAEQQAEVERLARERAQQHAERLVAQLRALGCDPQVEE